MPSPVQHRSNFGTNVTSVAIAFASNNAAGNLLSYSSAAANNVTINAATDNNTNTIANAVNVINGSGSAGNGRMDYVANSHSGANTVTGNSSASADIHVHIWEISGCVTASPVRDSGSVGAGGSTTGSVSTAGTSTLSGDAVLAFFYDNPANDALTAGSGYSPSELSANSTGGDAAISEYKSATAGGTQTATCGGNGTSALGPQIIVTFKQTAVSAFDIPQLGMMGVGF